MIKRLFLEESIQFSSRMKLKGKSCILSRIYREVGTRIWIKAMSLIILAACPIRNCNAFHNRTIMNVKNFLTF